MHQTIRRSTFFIIITLFSLFIFPVSSSAAIEGERWIVSFEEGGAEALLTDERIDVHYHFEHYQAAAVTLPPSIKKEWEASPFVAWMEEDSEVQLSGQMIDWGFTKLKTATAHTNRLTGKGVKIAILDSGVQKKHPDLKIAGGISFVGAPNEYEDTNGHGTHVAGIIGAQNNMIGTIGVAPDASLYIVKVMNEAGTGNQSDIVQGVEWAVAKGVDIINLSVTTERRSRLLEVVLRDAYEQGILLVAASGNNLKSFQAPVNVLFPARYQTVIAVGAIDQYHRRAHYSYYGPALEFVAPGEDIMSTYLITAGAQPYAESSGTSMAAPFVAGVAALYKEAYPNISHKAIRKLMQDHAIDLGKKGRDDQFGFGLIQAPQMKQPMIFPDVVVGDWYEPAITAAYRQQWISGSPDGFYYPKAMLTRAEAVTMISRALQLQPAKQPVSFFDVPSTHFAAGYIAAGKQRGFIAGDANGLFHPQASITRADVAVLLTRAFQISGTDGVNFTDINEAKYYAKAIHALKAAGVATGFPDGTYAPLQPITRAEFAVLLKKTVEK